MLVIWWSVAIKRYLKIPHGAGVTLALTLIACLVWLAITWFIHPTLAADFFEIYETGLMP